MPPMGFSSWLDSLFAIGMASSFLGAYLSVSLIGLGTTLVLILGSLSIFRKEGFSIVKNNPLFIPIMLLSGAIIISIIFASPYDFEKPLGKLRYLVCFFIFTAFFVRAPQKLNWIEHWGVFLSVFLAVISVLQHFGVFSPLKWLFGTPQALIPGSHDHYLATGFSFHHNPFAATLNFLSAPLLALGLFSVSIRKRRVFFSSFVFCLVGIAMSFSRSSWIAWFVSTFVIFLLFNWRLALTFLGIIATGAVGLFFYYLPIQERLSNAETSASERFELWRVCLEMFKASPLIGHGFYSFGSRYQNYTNWHLKTKNFPVEAHNMYLDLLSGTGLLGSLTFLFFIATTLKVLVTGYRNTGFSSHQRAWLLGTLGMFISFMVGGCFDKLFYMTQTLVPMLFFLSIGIALTMQPIPSSK